MRRSAFSSEGFLLQRSRPARRKSEKEVDKEWWRVKDGEGTRTGREKEREKEQNVKVKGTGGGEEKEERNWRREKKRQREWLVLELSMFLLAASRLSFSTS